MKKNEISIDTVYEIAAEVAESTVKTFLSNLVKLVPSAEDVVDTIRDSQYKELQKLRRGSASNDYEDEEEYEDFEESEKPLKESTKRPAKKTEELTLKDLVDDDADFAEIAHPTASTDASMNIDDALSQISLENSDLLGAAANSEIEPCTVAPGSF